MTTLVWHRQQFPSQYAIDSEDPHFYNHMRTVGAKAIAERLRFDPNLMDVTVEPGDMTKGKPHVITCSLLVEGCTKLDTVKADIDEMAKLQANKIIDKATELIMNWGSHYGQKSISKADAVRFLNEARNTKTKSAAKDDFPLIGEK